MELMWELVIFLYGCAKWGWGHCGVVWVGGVYVRIRGVGDVGVVRLEYVV